MAGEAYRVRVRPPNSDLWFERSDLEVLSVEIGLNEPRTAVLFHGGRHDQVIGLDVNWQVQISPDSLFRTLVFNGLVQSIEPRGLSSEGITINCVGIEWVLQRITLRWNSLREWTYNPNGYIDMRSEAFGTTVSDGVLFESNGVGARWYISDIIADILEHCFGLPYGVSENADYSTITTVPAGRAVLFSPYHSGIISTLARPSRSGGVAPSYHHPSDSVITNKVIRSLYAPLLRDSLLSSGARFGWFWSEIYDMHYPAQEVRLSGSDTLWDAISTLVAMTGSHAFYVDHSIPSVPVIRFVNVEKWNSYVDIPINIQNVHASTASYSLLDESFTVDSSSVRNRVVVVVNGLVTSGPGPLVPDTTMNRMLQTSDNKMLYAFANLHDVEPVMGGDVTDPANLDVVKKAQEDSAVRDRSDWGPRIVEDGAENATFDFVPGQGAAIVVPDDPTNTGIPNQLTVSGLFRRPAEFAVGPDPRSNKYFPRPSPFDAWANWSLCSEVVIEDPGYVPDSVPAVEGADSLAPEGFGIYMPSIRTKRAQVQYDDQDENGNPITVMDEYTLWSGERVPSFEMEGLVPEFWDYYSAAYAAACQMQRRFRDVTVSLTFRRDLIKSVRQHTDTGPYWTRPKDPVLPEIEIGDFVRLNGVGVPIINMAVMKVSRIRIDVRDGVMDVTASSDVAGQSLSFEDLYMRVLHERSVMREIMAMRKARSNDTMLGRGELPAAKVDFADALARPDMIIPVIGTEAADGGAAGGNNQEPPPVKPKPVEADHAGMGVKTKTVVTDKTTNTQTEKTLTEEEKREVVLLSVGKTDRKKIKAIRSPIILRDKAGNNYLVGSNNVMIAFVLEPLHNKQRGLYKLAVPSSIALHDPYQGISGKIDGDEIEAINILEADNAPAPSGYVGLLDYGDVVLVVQQDGQYFMLAQPYGIGTVGS